MHANFVTVLRLDISPLLLTDSTILFELGLRVRRHGATETRRVFR